MAKIVMLERENIGEDVDLSAFEALGELTVYERCTPEQIAERIEDAEVVILNKMPMNETTLADAKKLKLLCVTATGMDNVDLSYCESRGIAVKNVKGYSTATVVQHTFAIFFYLYEKLAYYDTYVKDGSYTKCPVFTHFGERFHELSGKTWGIVGMGEIGRGVAAAATVFGCNVIYYSTSGKNHNQDYREVTFAELLAEADVISVHAPLNEKTRYLFDEAAFAAMKPEAYLINVGRGPIVDTKALFKALDNNLIAGAALDVLEQEPMTEENPLLKIKDSRKLIITPHIAWASVEARRRLMHEVYANIAEN